MTANELNFVVAADRRVIAGLHVAVYSVLEHLSDSDAIAVFNLYTDDLSESDVDLLRHTLGRTEKAFEVRVHRQDVSILKNFPTIKGSVAAYFRLLAMELLKVPKFVYFDVDILCRINLGTLFDVNLNEHPIALVPEVPMELTADVAVREHLGEDASGMYYNTGLMVADTRLCQSLGVTNRCITHIANHGADYWDQSAINCVLHGQIQPLESKFNTFTNVRKNWPILRSPACGNGTLMHFIDSPKPWHCMGKWIHPMGRLWWEAFEKTAARDCSRKIVPRGFHSSWGASRSKYRKVIKDRLLFMGYELKLLQPKAVP